MKYKCICGNPNCKISFSSFKRGARCKKCAAKRNSGKNNPRYNPNLTDEERNRNRNSPEDNKWRKDVYKKNYWTCQHCFKKGGKLVAHHLESYDVNIDLRLVVSNGITLCEKHHIEFHKKYGYGYNNREQFEDFLKKYQKNAIIISIVNGLIKQKIN